ncbi:MAG: hypothetical protein ACM3L9_01900 [Deltaproteobacteria bacterium]
MICAQLDTAGFTVTIQIADGTYTTGVNIDKGWVGGGTVVFQGNSTTPANVIISTTSDHCFDIAAPLAGPLTIRDMDLRTTTSGRAISHDGDGVLRFTNLRFGACADGHMLANGLAKIITEAAYTISGSAPAHFICNEGGAIVLQGTFTVTLTGSPNFSFVFAFCTRTGKCVIGNAVTFSGAATGTKFLIDTGGILYLEGAATTKPPGNTPGTGGTTAGGGFLA